MSHVVINRILVLLIGLKVGLDSYFSVRNYKHSLVYRSLSLS